jgi:hypothetical protein
MVGFTHTRKLVGSAWTAQFVGSMMIQGLGSLVVFMTSRYFISPNDIGWFVSAVNAGVLVGLPVVGMLLDDYPPMFVAMTGTIAMCGGVLGLGMTRHLLMALVALFIIGIGYATVQPVGNVILVRVLKDKSDRRMAMGWRQTAIPLGGLATLIGWRVIIGSYGAPIVFLLWAVVLILGTVPLLAILRTTHATPFTKARKLPQGSCKKLPDMLSRFPVRIIVLGLLLICIQTLLVTFTVAANHRNGPIILASAFLAGAFGRLFWIWWARRYHVAFTTLLYGCIGGSAVLTGTFPWWSLEQSIVSGLLGGLWGLFSIGWYGVFVNALTEATPERWVGTVLGWTLSANQTIIVLTPLIFSWALTTHPVSPWIIVSVGVLVASCLTGMQHRNLPPSLRGL